jgi:hypothetical protein
MVSYLPSSRLREFASLTEVQEPMHKFVVVDRAELDGQAGPELIAKRPGGRDLIHRGTEGGVGADQGFAGEVHVVLLR